MNYAVETKSLPERKELISNGVEASDRVFRFYEYQNKDIDLPIVRLDIRVPVYRMENYRTRTEQSKYIKDNKKNHDFFSSGQENDSSQTAQHAILCFFAKQGTSSVTPIFNELKTVDQKEPLLITASGVVVNGNRRLAAMRELLAEDGTEYKRFNYIECAVLPKNITTEEIREIEIRLQMRPQTKLDYSWIVESIAIRELQDSGKTIQDISELMKKKKLEIDRAAQALVEADLYLKEWLEQPGAYQLVEDSEQFFNDLAKSLSDKEGEELEASRRIAWSLISNPRKLRRRVYDYNFSFDKKTGEVISSLADRLGIDMTAQNSQNDDDVFELDFGSESPETSLEPVIEAFDDKSQRDSLAQALVDVCEMIIDLDRQDEVGRKALLAVQAANNKLQDVDLSKADTGTYQTIDAQLESIIERAIKIKEDVSFYIDAKDVQGKLT